MIQRPKKPMHGEDVASLGHMPVSANAGTPHCYILPMGETNILGNQIVFEEPNPQADAVSGSLASLDYYDKVTEGVRSR
jgi:hypothetical protein